MTSKTEASVIRSQLALRYNYVQDTWEVYTTNHGSGIFRWMMISVSTKKWYVDNFPTIKMEQAVRMNNDGSILDAFQPIAS